MNGIHDMGGMNGLGPVRPGADEAPFHAPYEARAFAHLLALGALGKWNNDMVRSHFENFVATDYLRMTYFERWNAGLIELLVETGVITRAEAANGRADPASGKAVPALAPDSVRAMIAAGEPFDRVLSTAPRFREGETVRTKNLHPIGHTRMPRYARDKSGVVQRCHGGFVFPDQNARSLGEQPQHLYSVRFEAEELWGSERGARRCAVFIDLWEAYLAP